MTAKDFCHKMGFFLEPSIGEGKCCTIDVIDTGRRIYKTGRREGTLPKTVKTLSFHLEQAYDELMNLILDLAFD